jgi:hypothetical protein
LAGCSIATLTTEDVDDGVGDEAEVDADEVKVEDEEEAIVEEQGASPAATRVRSSGDGYRAK